MRDSLKDLINNSIIFKYNLPNTGLDIEKSIISTDDDSCYSFVNDESAANIIYNSVIEYAFNEYKIQDTDFDTLHSIALGRKLKFNHEADDKTKLKYGFYGEVLLYCFLNIIYKAPPVISRGYLYQILENSETKGYDAYHFIEHDHGIDFWFGEVKFYADFKAATTGKNGAVTNLKKAISDGYFIKNLIAIVDNGNHNIKNNSKLKPILDQIEINPEISIKKLSQSQEIKLIYPVLILFNKNTKCFDSTIKESMKHLHDNIKKEDFDISINISLFFIFVPVESSKNVKLKVLEWIKDKKQLLS